MRLRKSRPYGVWNTGWGQSFEAIKNSGLPIPARSRSDYQLLKWAIGISEDPRQYFADLDYRLVLTVHSLGQQDHRVEFDLVWENDGFAKLQAR